MNWNEKDVNSWELISTLKRSLARAERPREETPSTRTESSTLTWSRRNLREEPERRLWSLVSILDLTEKTREVRRDSVRTNRVVLGFDRRFRRRRRRNLREEPERRRRSSVSILDLMEKTRQVGRDSTTESERRRRSSVSAEKAEETSSIWVSPLDGENKEHERMRKRTKERKERKRKIKFGPLIWWHVVWNPPNNRSQKT